MSQRSKFHLIFSIGIVVGAFILNWLIMGETSPWNEYFLWHVGIPNIWRTLNVVPGIISAIAAGNIHGGNEAVFYIAFIIQWFVVGWTLSFVILAFRNKPLEPTSILK